MTWVNGHKLQNGKYTIEKKLGDGGFGITYLARNPSGQRVVIKTLNDTVQNRPDFNELQQDFLNEALRLAKCTHPHIVKIHEVVQEGRLWCMVMEYIDGEDLANRVIKQGVLPEAEALRYSQQIGEALTVVHQQGLLHRDVKPQNIMLRPKKGGMEAILIDFGIAREFTPDLTQTHTEYRTEFFAPIEQYDRRAKRGAYTDVYALAATLYVILTGQLPEASPVRAAGTPLTPPKHHNSSISDNVNRGIIKGMALKAKDRPQSVAEWLKLLGLGSNSLQQSQWVGYIALIGGVVAIFIGFSRQPAPQTEKIATPSPINIDKSPTPKSPSSTRREVVSPPRTPQTTTSGKLDLTQNLQLTGAGASFPAPIYQAWFQDINKKYPQLQISYQSIGSSTGVEQFTKGTVDFGASDVAIKDDEIAKVQKGVLMLPMTAGSIVLAYNIPGVDTGLKLPRQVYVDILLGKIKNWSDPRITAANPGVNLPNLPITVVTRFDASNTTSIFTKHLSAISTEFKTKVGEGKVVKWPYGISTTGNEGVTTQITQIAGSIGYVEYGYAKQTGLKYAALENKTGNFVIPNDDSSAKTLEAVTLPDNLRAFIEDPAGADSYPIVSYTWMLVYKQYPDAAKARAIEAMIEYGLTEGQKISPLLGYVPLPKNVIEKVAAAADTISPDYKIDIGKF